jgi:hypothetical protein
MKNINQTMDKLIIGFDGWTMGSRHYSRLVPELKKNGFKLLLVHIGSWGHDVNRPKTEMIDNCLEVRDVKYYDGLSFLEILKIEKPVLILFLSTRSLAHISFNRYAKYLHIPTCHLYHGLVTVQAVSLGENYGDLKLMRLLNLIYSRFYKNLIYIIPSYVMSLFRTEARIEEWLQFIKIIMMRMFGNFYDKNDPYVSGTSTEFGLVYVDSDREHMIMHYHVNKNNIGVIGNPDIQNLGIDEIDLLSCFNNSNTDNTIIYIDTGFLACGLSYSSENRFLEHLCNTREILHNYGYELKVKLHPMHDNSKVSKELQINGVVLLDREEFSKELRTCLVVISEPSSASLAPCMLGIPRLLAQYGPLEGQEYGSVLRTYPLSAALVSLKEIEKILSEIKLRNVGLIEMQKWVDENCGPRPFSAFANRAVYNINQFLMRPHN